jgi:cob(I)alamin adenosyltransferase
MTKLTLKIYTKTGDKGQTSLFGGKRVSKSSVRVEAYGTVDELNSIIGVVLSMISNKQQAIRKELVQIQNDLLDIGSTLASPGITKHESRIKNLGSRTKEIENVIDNLTEQLPPLQNFILPGGGKGGALLHQSRTICRRAERRIVELAKKENVEDEILTYFNRLSDLLFTMARYVNFAEKKKEIIWSKK